MIMATITAVVLMTYCQDIRGKWTHNKVSMSPWNPPPHDSALEARAVGAQSGVTNGSAVRPQCYHIHAHLLSYCWQCRNVMRAGRHRGASPTKWQCCDQTRLTCRNDQDVCVKLGTAPCPKQIWGPLKTAFYQPNFINPLYLYDLSINTDFFPKRH